MARMTITWPLIVSACADCGIGTIRLGEWYMVRDEVWEQAWCGRRKPWHVLPGQEVLCIGCLEKRLGRTLLAGARMRKSTIRTRTTCRRACALG
jgi:hypothetical protein